jgi:hypothetical protein
MSHIAIKPNSRLVFIVARGGVGFARGMPTGEDFANIRDWPVVGRGDGNLDAGVFWQVDWLDRPEDPFHEDIIKMVHGGTASDIVHDSDLW